MNKTELSKIVAEKIAKKAQEKKLRKYTLIEVFTISWTVKAFAETLEKMNGILIMENYKDEKDDILEKLVHINRITKVVKGGRRFGFSALLLLEINQEKLVFTRIKLNKSQTQSKSK